MDASQLTSAITFSWKESLLYATLLHLAFILFLIRNDSKGSVNPAILMFAIPLNLALSILLLLIHTLSPVHFNGGYWVLWVGMFFSILIAGIIDAFKEENI